MNIICLWLAVDNGTHIGMSFFRQYIMISNEEKIERIALNFSDNLWIYIHILIQYPNPLVLTITSDLIRVSIKIAILIETQIVRNTLTRSGDCTILI